MRNPWDTLNSCRAHRIKSSASKGSPMQFKSEYLGDKHVEKESYSISKTKSEATTFVFFRNEEAIC